MKSFSLFSSLIFVILSCAAFPGKTKFIGGEFSNITRPVRLQFTGFVFFEKEQQGIKQKILNSGYSEDLNSKLLLEVILEEQTPHYPYPKLHFANFFLSLFTATFIPYHIVTEHRVVYRFLEDGKIKNESEFKINLHQYRGLLVLLLSPFYWPSNVFRENILTTWKQKGESK